MSEFTKSQSSHFEKLYVFSKSLIKGGNGKQLIEQYKNELSTITPAETMQVFDRLLNEGFDIALVKSNVGKLINVFYKSLTTNPWNPPSDNHFLSYLMQENRAVEKIMAEITAFNRMYLKPKSVDAHRPIQTLLSLLDRLKEYELHYIKKEIILFPYIEQCFPQYMCLKIMWSFHDDFRKSLKNLTNLLKEENPDWKIMNTEMGRLYFVVLPLIFREEAIVFPVAHRAIPETSWAEMLKQSSDIGWCYDIKPAPPQFLLNNTLQSDTGVNLLTGILTNEQIILLLNHLPIDITLVDKNDTVCYFSESADRIFPRSKAILGRKVQNCHPPESVHVVNEIVEAFRNGTKSHADFWIQMKERFIHIRYFAIRDEKGMYQGTLEVSQDVTEIRELKGEQRLLDWKL